MVYNSDHERAAAQRVAGIRAYGRSGWGQGRRPRARRVALSSAPASARARKVDWADAVRARYRSREPVSCAAGTGARDFNRKGFARNGSRGAGAARAALAPRSNDWRGTFGREPLAAAPAARARAGAPTS